MGLHATTLKGHFCNIIILSTHNPTDNKSDKELEQVFEESPMYQKPFC
jgi:hypothetical protein